MSLKLAGVAVALLLLAAEPALARDAWQQRIQLETELAQRITQMRSLQGLRDCTNRIAVAQGRMASAQADADLSAYGQKLHRADFGGAELEGERERLRAAATSWFAAIENPLNKGLLDSARKELATWLAAGQDPAPLLERTAKLVGGSNPFAGHRERVIAAFAAPQARERIAAVSGSPPKTTSPPATTRARPTPGETDRPRVVTPPAPVLGPRPAPASNTAYDAELRDAGMEPDTDRPGMDLESIELDSPDPSACLVECQDYGGCKAFTYVKPNVQGPKARCWLKSGIPAAMNSTCCISGRP